MQADPPPDVESRQDGVYYQLEQLEKILARTTDDLHNLIEKIRPILSDDYPVESAAKSMTVSGTMSDLADRLASVKSKLFYLDGAITYTTGRVDL